MRKIKTLGDMWERYMSFVFLSMLMGLVSAGSLVGLISIPASSETSTAFQLLIFMGVVALWIIFTFISSVVLYLLYGLLIGIWKVIILGLSK